MNVLVAYASKRGSTAEIAEAVAATLHDTGLEVDLAKVNEIKSLEPYDALVLGSAVYMKCWQGDAKHFLRKHRLALIEMPFWVFSSGPVGDPDEDQPEWVESPKFIDKVEQLGARGHVVFGGRLAGEPRGPIERAMVAGTPPEHRDRRDWDQIQSWASSVAVALGALAPVE